LARELEAVSGQGNDERTLYEKAVERRDLYGKEIALIRDMQEAGGAAVEATGLRASADGLRYLYQRHYAGKSRVTRDVRLLGELTRQMAGLQQAMFALYQGYPETDGLGEGLESINGWLDLYRKETQTIVEAQSSGTIDERFSMLAKRANEQFKLYQQHFAGKGRLSRRIDLLEDILANLRDIGSAMERLDASSLETETTEHLDRNKEIVADRLAFYKTESGALGEARSGTGPHERTEAIAGSLSDVLQAYNRDFAGQDRTTRDLEAVGTLCDEAAFSLWTLRDNLDEASGNTAIQRHICFAEDVLDLLEREYRMIEEAQTT
jgi:hypothetical protein